MKISQNDSFGFSWQKTHILPKVTTVDIVCFLDFLGREKAPTVVKILHFKEDDTFLLLNAHIGIPTLNFFGKNGIFYQFLSYDMSGNTVFPQATDFQKLAKIDHFLHY